MVPFETTKKFSDRVMQHSTLIFSGERLSWSILDNVVEVCLHRAPCNEIGQATVVELKRLSEWLKKNLHRVRVLIWYSACESGFSAGDDLWEMRQRIADGDALSLKMLSAAIRRFKGRGHARAESVAHWLYRRVSPFAIGLEFKKYAGEVHALFNAFDSQPFVTIAATHGVVFGGGLELALTADIIIAEKQTRFALPELRLGMIPSFGAIPRLKREVGNAVIRDLLFTGRSLRARRAHELGLVSQLVGSDQALKVARSIAKQARLYDPLTVKRAKQFTKTFPQRALWRERLLSAVMASSEVVKQALEDFALRKDIMPFLPVTKASRR